MKKETPLDLLKKRFAKGEISKEDFEDIKSTLLK
jgi:putative membrane protein